MANGAAFDDAVRLARETPSLDIGCHLVLIGGRSLLTGRPYPHSVPRLVAALARRELRAYEELKTQVQRIMEAGIKPTHLDTHKHTHLVASTSMPWRASAKSSASVGCGVPSIFPHELRYAEPFQP